MRGDPAARRVAQLVLQRLGEGLHAGLGDVVGGVARRRGDALLGAGVDDEARAGRARSCRARRPAAPWMTPQRLTASTRCQASARAEDGAAGLDAGIVHQHVGAAEALAHRRLEPAHRVGAADVGLDRHDARRAPPGATAASASARRRPAGRRRGRRCRRAARVRAKRRAAARPMPEAPPVTTATESGARASWDMRTSPDFRHGWCNAAGRAGLLIRFASYHRLRAAAHGGLVCAACGSRLNAGQSSAALTPPSRIRVSPAGVDMIALLEAATDRL